MFRSPAVCFLYRFAQFKRIDSYCWEQNHWEIWIVEPLARSLIYSTWIWYVPNAVTLKFMSFKRTPAKNGISLFYQGMIEEREDWMLRYRLLFLGRRYNEKSSFGRDITKHSRPWGWCFVQRTHCRKNSGCGKFFSWKGICCFVRIQVGFAWKSTPGH